MYPSAKPVPVQYSDQDLKALATAAYTDPLDRAIVNAFIEAFDTFESRPDHERLNYLKLKFLHQRDSSEILNAIAATAAANSHKHFLSYACLLESLRLNPNQETLLSRIEALGEACQPRKIDVSSAHTCAVSVIMGTNRDSLEIQEAITSVLNQTFEDFELIIINDGGPESLQEIVSSFKSPKIRYKRLESNQGISRARNEGLCMAQGRFIAFLDDDDVFYSNHLEVVVDAAVRHNAKVVYSIGHAVRGELVNGKFQKMHTAFVWDEPYDPNLLAERAAIMVHNVLLERAVFAQVGGFNEALEISEDEDLWLRLAKQHPFLQVRQITGEWRIKPDNSGGTRRIQCFFYGTLVRRYYAFFQGRLACLKRAALTGDAEQFRHLYHRIMQEFPKTPKTRDMAQELLPMAQRMKDHQAMMSLYRVLFQYAHQGTLAALVKARQWGIFMLLLPEIIRWTVSRFTKSISSVTSKFDTHYEF